MVADEAPDRQGHTRTSVGQRDFVVGAFLHISAM
jgi:hypothetical protein